MAKKKITIPTTPNRGNLGEAIDSWVNGETKDKQTQLKKENGKKLIYARTTFQIPTGLYKKLKKIALIEDKSVTKKLTEILEKTLPEIWLYVLSYLNKYVFM